MWFWLSLIALLCWSGSDLFSKIGCRDARDKYSHLKMVMAVGVVMGLHAAYEVFVGGTVINLDILLTYLPVSLLYILSMAMGYVGLRYIELSISSPICNSSGALVAVLEQRSQSLDPAELVAGWDFGVINDNEAGQTVKFQVTVARYDPEEEPEVFFLLSGLGVGAKREPADKLPSAQDAGVYTATINLAQWQVSTPFTLSVGFVKDGVEYLQPLADFSFLDRTSSAYEPLWP